MYRSTTLNMVARYCPGALTHYEQNVPYDRSMFSAGIAAHALLQAATEHPGKDVAEAVAHRLVTEGRSFDGVPEPPLSPEAVAEGVTLGLRWLEENPIPEGAQAELGLGLAADLRTAAPYESAYVRAILDITYTEDIEQEDGFEPLPSVTVCDYKSAWPTDAADVDSLQLKIQGLAAVAAHPEAAILRREIVNLRTRQRYSDELVLDDVGQARLEEWRRAVRLAIAQADLSPRPFVPGVGCFGCPYLTRCDAARAFLRGSVLDGGPEAVATRYAVVEAMREALGAALRQLVAESPIQVGERTVQGLRVGGGYVGYGLASQRRPSPDGASVVGRAWFGEASDREIGLLEAVKLGSKQIATVAKRLFPHKRGTDWKEKRAAFEAEALVTVGVSRFGLHREKMEMEFPMDEEVE